MPLPGVNQFSLLNTLRKVVGSTESVTVFSLKDTLLKDDVVVMPGVGHFSSAAAFLEETQMKTKLVEFIRAGGRFIGICLGMQLLFSESDEGSGEGLGIFSEKILRLPENLKTPHVGWNQIHLENSDLDLRRFDGLDFYFVHSFAVPVATAGGHVPSYCLSTTEHGDFQFVSAVELGNTVGFQFHPEKSGRLGVELLDEILKRWR